MANLNLSNNRSDRQAANTVDGISSTLQDDIATLKSDVIKLTEHFHSGNIHLLNDLKETLDAQWKKAKGFSATEIKKMESYVQGKPTQSVLIAFCAGLAASILLSRK
jgi:ElaB/YqjD/DUF883 family membrane-anchored ribosome-binding protein